MPMCEERRGGRGAAQGVRLRGGGAHRQLSPARGVPGKLPEEDRAESPHSSTSQQQSACKARLARADQALACRACRRVQHAGAHRIRCAGERASTFRPRSAPGRGARFLITAAAAAAAGLPPLAASICLGPSLPYLSSSAPSWRSGDRRSCKTSRAAAAPSPATARRRRPRVRSAGADCPSALVGGAAPNPHCLAALHPQRPPLWTRRQRMAPSSGAAPLMKRGTARRACPRGAACRATRPTRAPSA